MRTRDVTTNLVWLVAERGVRLLVGFAIGLLVARYLGPSQFGRLSYAMSFVALFGFLVPLGMDVIAKRESLAAPDRNDLIISTVLISRTGALALSILAIWVASSMMPPNERLLVIAATGSLLAPLAGSFDLVLKAQLRGRLTFTARFVATLSGAIVRLILLYFDAPVEAFALAASIEAVFTLIALAITARHIGLMVSFSACDWTMSVRLLRESWPLMLSGLAVTIYGRIDQLMLRHFLDTASVGMYAAATRLSECAHFFPMVLASSVFPALARARQENTFAFTRQVRRFFALSAVLGYALASILSFGSHFWVRFTYGPSFSAAAPILTVHAWAAIFVFLGVARSQVLVLERIAVIQLVSTGSGAIVNVIANFFWIPAFGAVGAAWATVCAQACAVWLSLALFRKSRGLFWQLTTALTAPVTGWRALFSS